MSTIYEVARLAGVSPKTAARILSGEKGRPKNREKILAAAAELNYVRNQQAATLRSGRSGLIGLIVPDIRNPYYPHFFKVVHDVCLETGHQVLLADTGGRAADEAGALRLFGASRVEGLILDASLGEPDISCDPLLRVLISQGSPVILAGRPARGLPVDELAVDNLVGVASAVRHLAERGKRRLAFVCGERDLPTSRERHSGFIGAVAGAGLESRPDWSVFGEYTAESGYLLARRLLEAEEHPDAIVAANDIIAVGVLEAAAELGLTVPKQVAVVGFDDIPMARHLRPRLTTLRQPVERMAGDCIRLLINRINKSDTTSAQQLNYRPELVVREST